MKKLLSLLLCSVMGLTITGCSNGGETSKLAVTIESKYQPIYKTEVKYKNTSLKGILDDIYADQKELENYLKDESIKLIDTPIESYDAYVEFMPKIEEFLKLCESETEKFLKRLEFVTYDYYHLMPSKYKEEEFEGRAEALEELYFAVYDTSLKNMDSAIYGGVMEDVMDYYYDTLVDGYFEDDNLSYKKVSDTSSETYKMISNYASDYYKLVSRYASDWYQTNSRIVSLIYNDDYDEEHLNRILDNPREEETE